MNNWEKTLQRFNALGGVAENVELREGVYGRGLFPKDLNKSVKMSIPKHLLLPTEWLQLDEYGQLILNEACDWSDETKAFFLDYQRDYGIGGSLMQEIMQQQSQLFDLPESLKAKLIGYGIGQRIFQKPSLQTCLDTYKRSRRMLIANDKLVLMPLLELANHSEHSNKTFGKVPHLGFSGNFTDEILVNYGMVGDATLMFEAYGFSVPKPYTFSGTLAINMGTRVIKISRFVKIYKTIEKTNVPKLRVEGNEIHLSCLVVGSVNDRNSPKKIFRKLMYSVGMPAHTADKIFDGIIDQNRGFFLHLLEEIKPLEGKVVESLRTMARNQLIPLGVHV